jgi:dihydroxy-acid dehydratase
MTYHDGYDWAEHESCLTWKLFNNVQVQDGDIISIDASSRQMDMDVSDAELQKRREAWTAPPYKSKRGTLYKYIKNVSSASLGCVTDL